MKEQFTDWYPSSDLSKRYLNKTHLNSSFKIIIESGFGNKNYNLNFQYNFENKFAQQFVIMYNTYNKGWKFCSENGAKKSIDEFIEKFPLLLTFL
jgi:hypothetical protein